MMMVRRVKLSYLTRFVLPKCRTCGALAPACDVETALQVMEEHKRNMPKHVKRVFYVPTPPPGLPF